MKEMQDAQLVTKGNDVRRMRDLYTDLMLACARRRRMNDCLCLIEEAELHGVRLGPKLLQVRARLCLELSLMYMYDCVSIQVGYANMGTPDELCTPHEMVRHYSARGWGHGLGRDADDKSAF